MELAIGILIVYAIGIPTAWAVIAKRMYHGQIEEHLKDDMVGAVLMGLVAALLWPLLIPAMYVVIYVKGGKDRDHSE
jgi:hypothetical protein